MQICKCADETLQILSCYLVSSIQYRFLYYRISTTYPFFFFTSPLYVTPTAIHT